MINEFEGDDEEEADADQGLDGDVFDEHQIISRGWKFYDAYDYVSPTGVVLYQMRRYHHSLVPKLKKFVAIRPDNSAGVHCDPDEVVRWLVGNGGLSVIYNWREITMLKDDVVHVFEGEKNAKRGISLGLLGTTVAGQTWTETAAEALRGRDVIIYQDNDEPGRKNTFNAVEALTDLAKTVRVVRLPGLAHKNDFSDWMDAGHTLEELEAVIAAAPVFGLTEFFNVDVWTASRSRSRSGVPSVTSPSTRSPCSAATGPWAEKPGPTPALCGHRAWQGVARAHAGTWAGDVH